jgi:hypothetical protein
VPKVLCDLPAWPARPEARPLTPTTAGAVLAPALLASVTKPADVAGLVPVELSLCRALLRVQIPSLAFALARNLMNMRAVFCYSHWTSNLQRKDAQMSERYHVIERCMCPVTKTPTREINVSPSYLKLVVNHFPPRCIHEMNLLIPTTLRSPNSLWKGVREPDPGEDHGGYCFSKPFPNKINGEGQSCPNPDGYVFCVYVNAEFVIYEFRWDEPDAADNRLPNGWSTRFHERVL